MKLYAAADIHGSQHRMNIALDHIQQYHPDLVVLCGDLTQFGPGSIAKQFVDQIPVKTFAVPGNIDTSDVVRALEESNAINLHRKKKIFNKIPFVGIGGDLSEPLSEIIIEDETTSTPLSTVVKKETVVVTHVPPYGLQDNVFVSKHIGNKELRQLIEIKQPRLVLCGHVHEDPGVTQFKNTVVVNCSLAKKSEGALIELDEKDTVVNIL